MEEEIKSLHSKQFDYPMSCLKSNEGILDYINEMYKDLDKYLSNSSEESRSPSKIYSHGLQGFDSIDNRNLN